MKGSWQGLPNIQFLLKAKTAWAQNERKPNQVHSRHLQMINEKTKCFRAILYNTIAIVCRKCPICGEVVSKQKVVMVISIVMIKKQKQSSQVKGAVLYKSHITSDDTIF